MLAKFSHIHREGVKLMSSAIDVVIPVAMKDLPKLAVCVDKILANSLTPIRNIYIVAPQTVVSTMESQQAIQFAHPKQSGVIWVDEATYPFTLRDIKNRLLGKNNLYNNSSWYYQQLLKFYCFKAIPNLQPNTLILDADCFVSQKIEFLTVNGQALLAYGYPFHWLLNTKHYPAENRHSHIDFAERFVPDWTPVNAFSGMQHHMLFQQAIMAKLFAAVETTHQKEFWQAFLDNVEFQKWNAASEYVIYYHFAMKFFPEQIVSRHLHSCDFIHDETENPFVLEVAQNTLQERAFQTIGCHSFLDLRARLKTMDYIPTDLKQKMLSVERVVFKLILDDSMLQIEAI